MDIIRIPKRADGTSIARLVISKGRAGGVEPVFSIEGAMSSSTEPGEYESFEQAEAAAVAAASQRQVSYLIIENLS